MLCVVSGVPSEDDTGGSPMLSERISHYLQPTACFSLSRYTYQVHVSRKPEVVRMFCLTCMSLRPAIGNNPEVENLTHSSNVLKYKTLETEGKWVCQGSVHFSSKPKTFWRKFHIALAPFFAWGFVSYLQRNIVLFLIVNFVLGQ